jgi:Zn-dependent protease with chaperone function
MTSVVTAVFCSGIAAGIGSQCRRIEGEDVRGMTDVAVLPLAVIVLSVYFFVMTPVTNTITRTTEYEADTYGLNAAGQPDGEAST